MRRAPWAADFELRGAYSLGCVSTKLVTGGAVTAQILFALRVAQPNSVLWFKKISVSAGTLNATAGIVNFNLFPCKDYAIISAFDAAATAFQPVPLRSTMPASFIGVASGKF